jgi:hypothetical protein
VRGLPALQYFGNVVWKDGVFEKINTGGLHRGNCKHLLYYLAEIPVCNV